MHRCLSFSLDRNSSYDIVKQMRDKVESILEHHSQEIRDATKMTVSELLENALKYGNLIDHLFIVFDFKVSDQEIVVEVTNGVFAGNDIDHLKWIIDQIQQSANPEELYVKRLKELVDNRPIRGESHLGLLRIAYEGNFALSYDLTPGKLKIIARRSL